MRVIAVAVAIILFAPTGAALGLLPPILPEPGEIVVGYKDGALGTVTDLVGSLGGQILRTDADLRFLVATTNSVTAILTSLLLSPSVEYAEKNTVVRLAGSQWNGAQWNAAEWNGAEWNAAEWNGAEWNGAEWDRATGNDPGFGSQWGLASIGAPAAWEITTGERKAKLCVLDTGVAWDHPDLAANVGSDRINVRDPTKSAYDDTGHGTHVAGIAAAVVGNGIGGSGVGNVTILPVKVLDSNGRGTEADLATGLVWCAKRGADVALMALSADDDGKTLERAIDYATGRDVLLVASAGNSGPCESCVAFPARHASVIAVSAIDKNGALASFSSRGSQIDLAAPGVGIVSTVGASGYASGSGTSQAAAFVAGAAALLRDAAPILDASATRVLLENSASDGTLDLGAAIGGLP